MRFTWLSPAPVWRWLLSTEVPGYRPGITVARVAKEIDPTREHGNPENPLALPLSDAFGADTVQLRECVERHFLMHIVTVQLCLRIEKVHEAHGHIRLRHSGWIKRGALECSLKSTPSARCKELANKLLNDAAVQKYLAQLDHKQCEIVGLGDAWEIRIEPYGGCDVVNRFPTMRRSIGIGQTQREILIHSAQALVNCLRSAQ